MERKGSRRMLWALAIVVGVIVIVGSGLTIHLVSRDNDARAIRCNDVVEERRGDRLLWTAIFEIFDDGSPSESLTQLRAIVDEFKPPLECSDQNIPVVIEQDFP